MSERAFDVSTPSPRPIETAAEAEYLIRHLFEVMDTLLAAIEEETSLVRTGNLVEAAKLEPTKSELARLYAVDTARIRANRGYIREVAPELVDELRWRHDAFRALLQINLTVLATAHAVSESIMRGVSAELARKATPHGYGATGQASTPTRGSYQPLTVSRVL